MDRRVKALTITKIYAKMNKSLFGLLNSRFVSSPFLTLFTTSPEPPTSIHFHAHTKHPSKPAKKRPRNLRDQQQRASPFVCNLVQFVPQGKTQVANLIVCWGNCLCEEQGVNCQYWPLIPLFATHTDVSVSPYQCSTPENTRMLITA